MRNFNCWVVRDDLWEILSMRYVRQEASEHLTGWRGEIWMGYWKDG